MKFRKIVKEQLKQTLRFWAGEFFCCEKLQLQRIIYSQFSLILQSPYLLYKKKKGLAESMDNIRDGTDTCIERILARKIIIIIV